jgi:hypothetical protein
MNIFETIRLQVLGTCARLINLQRNQPVVMDFLLWPHQKSSSFHIDTKAPYLPVYLKNTRHKLTRVALARVAYAPKLLFLQPYGRDPDLQYITCLNVDFPTQELHNL